MSKMLVSLGCLTDLDKYLKKGWIYHMPLSSLLLLINSEQKIAEEKRSCLSCFLTILLLKMSHRVFSKKLSSFAHF